MGGWYSTCYIKSKWWKQTKCINLSSSTSFTSSTSTSYLLPDHHLNKTFSL